MTFPALDSQVKPPLVVIIGGGSGERLGGTDKSQLKLGNKTFLEVHLHLLTDILGIEIESIVLVHPTFSAYPEGLTVVSESPAGGGPVAGIAAAMEALANRPARSTDTVAVLAVDAPLSSLVIPQLMRMRKEHHAEVVTATDDSDTLQYFPSLWSYGVLRGQLTQLPTVRNSSLKSLFRTVEVASARAPLWSFDVDTPEQLAALQSIVSFK